MIITKELNTAIDKIKEYNPNSLFLFQDSSFSRLSIVKSYAGSISLNTGELKKTKNKILAYLDQLPLEFRGQDFAYYYSRPVFITGIGLYGEAFIEDIRNYEAKNKDQHSPIILYGSPRDEKMKRISKFIDFFIDTRKPSAVQQLIYLINQLS